MLVQATSLDLAATHAAVSSVEIEDRVEIRAAAAQASASTSPADDSVDISDPKLLIAKWLFAYLSGRQPPVLHRGSARHSVPTWSVSYSHREVRRETEATTFSATGSVKLASGAQIDFSVNLSLYREQVQTVGFSFGAGNMTDPIVVNLDGAGARLTSDRQAFDLDGDGADEMIANLAAGSAWLARDVNSNGTIDDGSELFGPATGNGFAELAQLDADGNHWLDEGDAAYTQLGLWRDGAFTSLGASGIGALSTASVATPFTMKDGDNLLGQARAAGVYLREDGGAGVLQQIDLAT
jgi:hypothetical protein